MLVTNLGCPSHFAHRGAAGFWRSDFSNANSPAGNITERATIGSQEMLGGDCPSACKICMPNDSLEHPDSDRIADIAACLKGANTRLMHRSKKASLLDHLVGAREHRGR